MGAMVAGVDPAPVMLRVARLLTRPRATARYVKGVAEAIPQTEDSVSVARSIATVHHWSDVDAGLREIHRVLHHGGRLVAMERSALRGAQGHQSHGWTDEQATAFADRCRELGFSDVRLDRTITGRRSMVSVVASDP
jgi:ubiquinone/menaquinone biosynthesis C-methylase UbiE